MGHETPLPGLRRVLILGPCGAGKSTLARRLGPVLGLPIVHLDQQFWQPGWVMMQKDRWLERVEVLVSEELWLMDGNFDSSLHLRLPRADLAIILDLPRRRYLWRVVRRVLGSYGQVRADLAPGCPERFEWDFLRFVWRFGRDIRPRLVAALGGAEVPQLWLRDPAAVEALVAALERRRAGAST